MSCWKNSEDVIYDSNLLKVYREYGWVGAEGNAWWGRGDCDV